MTILVTKNQKNAEKINETDFGLESKLQEYIAENPEIIPVYEISEDIRLLILAREFPTSVGRIDALGFDAQGNIYIIETKLYKNAEGRREVIAQTLDYGASLWSNSNNFADFQALLDRFSQEKFKKSFQDKYKEFFELEDMTEQLQTIQNNLNSGVIKFVILVDKLHEQVKNLARYINQNSKFDLYLVEVKFYKHKDFEILIPKLYGAEVKKEVATKSKTGSNYTPIVEADFDKNIESSLKKVIIKLKEMYKELAHIIGGNVSYDQTIDFSRMCVNYNGNVDMAIYTDGSLWFYPFKKTGVQIDFSKKILDSLIDKKLFSKTEKFKTIGNWSVKLGKATASEIEEYLEINEKVLEALK